LTEPPINTTLAEQLREWRREKARALSVPAYVVLHDSTLEEIARRRPQTPAELSEIKGIGAGKIERFGEEMLIITRSVPAESHADGEREMEKRGAHAAPPLTLWLQIEMWRQGGREPDARALLAALDDPAGLERGSLVVVINALRDLGVRRAAGALLRLFGETSDAGVLSAISEAVGQLGVAEAAPALIRLLDDERAGARRASARALGRLRAPAALPRLERLASEDASESVRLAARAAVMLLTQVT
jgi:hypothetical protein